MDKPSDHRSTRRGPALFIHLRARQEDWPGEKWKQQFDKTWPFYRKWFLSEGYLGRPGYLTSYEALSTHMPELLPIYDQLVQLSGGGDLESRYLSQYCPPPYMTGCSQLAWTGPNPALIRNYDYSPVLFEGMLMKTNWLRPVIGMVDCSWGLLDGMNSDGLIVSLTFGGRRVTGLGFGIPLIVRYILETCVTTDQAVLALQRLPVHMAYNLTVMDRNLNYRTVYLAPDRPAQVIPSPVGTNHQLEVEWSDYARMTGTVERLQHLEAGLMDATMTRERWETRFMSPPLYNTQYEKAFGTLYTAVYDPINLTADIVWPTKRLRRGFDNFEEEKVVANVNQTVTTKFSL